MADDVEITAGSGTIIKTDQVGTDHVQYVKLMDGTLDGAGVIPGDTINGLDVDVTRLGRSINKDSFTAAGAITGSHVASGDERLCSVTLHLSSAPTGTASEPFTATLDANDGSAYDTLLVSVDPYVQRLTDYVFMPDGDLYLENGDAIDLAFANAEGKTYGVQITTESV